MFEEHLELVGVYLKINLLVERNFVSIRLGVDFLVAKVFLFVVKVCSLSKIEIVDY